MQFAVTGGAGFIGSNIARALLARGDSVRIIDNFATGNKENIPHGAELFEASITDVDEMRRALDGVQGVFHCAALPRVQVSIHEPLKTHETNINGTFHVIMAAKEAGVKRVVYSASSSAYGDQTELPLRETMQPMPKSPYGLQKYVGEHYMRLASMFWNVETVSLRYFNVYGPGMAMEGAYAPVITLFLQKQKRGEPLTVVGDGKQTRDFTYIDDVVRANLLAMESNKVGNGEVINIGAGDNHTVLEIAELVGGVVEHLPPRIEPHDTRADTTLARELLGWQPTMPFAQGMEKTIAWFRSLPHT